MRSNKTWLAEARLYLILDAQVNRYDELFEILKKSVRAGVDIVQLRHKNGSASDILNFTERALKITEKKIPFIVNDRLDLALISEASGVHLGQEDIPLLQARKLLGPRKIIGVSCQTLEQARLAERGGADYIGFGSVFKTQTKPGRSPMDLKLLEKVVHSISIPIFAIGGVTSENAGQLLKLGVQRVAICREISLARDVSKAASQMARILQ